VFGSPARASRAYAAAARTVCFNGSAAAQSCGSAATDPRTRARRRRRRRRRRGGTPSVFANARESYFAALGFQKSLLSHTSAGKTSPARYGDTTTR